jgi:hypothetical protein
MAPRPPQVFPGEKGFALLECLAEEGYRNRGKVTGCRYIFAKGQRRYVDVRDLSGMPRGAFVKVDDADTSEASEGEGEAP